MSTRTRAFTSIALLVLAIGLIGAHWLISNMAQPTYTRLCDSTGPGGAAVLVRGFGGGTDPTVVRACGSGTSVPVSARLDEARGELVLESRSRALLALDGQRSTSEVRVRAQTVDHSEDVWWIRALDGATPFADRELTEPYSSTGTESTRVIEVGRPRIEPLPGGGSRARIELFSHAQDESLTLFVTARSPARR